MFSTNDFPDQPASRRGRRLKVAGATATVGALAAGGLVVASNAGASGTVWDRVAHCESTGNWSINTGNSFYGGLQFTYQTWKGFGGQKYAYTADRATKGQQIEIAQEVLKVQGPGAWPVCSRKAGLTVANGLAVNPYSGEQRPSRDTSRTPTTSTGGQLAVDGVRGPKTNAAIEKWGGRPMNGYLDVGDKQALQRRVGTAQDGVVGPLTTRALQRKVGASVDGQWGPQTTSRLQTYLNRHVL
ncbi:transglycosylase family protein [Janibacter sp. GS2]|uniref:transglycosylase family protein n=1 Tax=Janibacter sp. GS2 TaxID=3442646 RepID=UPI003EBADDF4